MSWKIGKDLVVITSGSIRLFKGALRFFKGKNGKVVVATATNIITNLKK